jgi:PAS domain S-box-containing protein
MWSLSEPDAREESDLPEAVLDAIGEAIFVIDAEGRVVRWNQMAASLTGISFDQIRRRVFLEALPTPSDVESWKREFKRISEGLSPRHFESSWKNANNSPLSLTCFCSAIRDSAGKIQHIVCTFARSLSGELMADHTAELLDISHFLHDTIVQDLVVLSFSVGKLEDSAADPASDGYTGPVLNILDRCIRDARIVNCMLVAPSLCETTLGASIERYAEYVREETGLPIVLDIEPAPDAVRPDVQLLFLAAVHEWVARGIRSRLKARLSIRLRNGSEGTALELETVCLAPTPNGLPAPRGWGLIRERTHALGGQFEISGGSSSVSARIWFRG